MQIQMKQRMTPIREDILLMLKKKHLVSAGDILRMLEQKFSGINKTTVYRALEFLLSSGMICQHQFDNKEALYELRNDHHDHLICTRCLKTQSSECITDLPKSISGFQVEHHHLTVYGICSDCQKRKTAPSHFSV